jgi:hypothetical protein
MNSTASGTVTQASLSLPIRPAGRGFVTPRVRLIA